MDRFAYIICGYAGGPIAYTTDFAFAEIMRDYLAVVDGWPGSAIAARVTKPTDQAMTKHVTATIAPLREVTDEHYHARVLATIHARLDALGIPDPQKDARALTRISARLDDVALRLRAVSPAPEPGCYNCGGNGFPGRDLCPACGK